jgi:L-2-hydroxyglutarate oxidase LhgO
MGSERRAGRTPWRPWPIDVDAAGYRLHYWKGSYFALASSRPGLVSRLIYPVPDRVSLGVHALLDLGGRLRFGPDAEARADRTLDYRVEEGRRAAFAESVRRLIPSVKTEELVPDMSGIRPLQAPGEPAGTS